MNLFSNISNQNPRKTALLFSGLYLVIALLVFSLSNVIFTFLHGYTGYNHTLHFINEKKIAVIVLTAVLLYFIIQRFATELYNSHQALKIKEERFRLLFANMASGVAIYRAVNNGEDFEFIDFNKAAQRIEKIHRQNLIGRRVTEVFPGIHDFGLLEVFQRVWQSGEAEHFPIAKYKDNRLHGWRKNFVYKLNSGEIVTIYQDVTEQKLASQELKQSEILLQTEKQIITAFHTKQGDEIFSQTLKDIQVMLESPLGFFGYINEAGFLVCPAFSQGIMEECTMADKTAIFPPDSWDGVWGDSLRQQETVVKNTDLATPHGHLPLSAALAVPIKHKGQLIGQIFLANRQTSYGPEQVAFIEHICTYLAPLLHSHLQAEKSLREQQQATDRQHKSETRLKEAEAMAGLGNWQYDFFSQELTWSDETFRIFNQIPQSLQPSYKFAVSMIHPNDRQMVKKAYTDSVANHTLFDIHHRLLLPGKVEKFVMQKCRTEYDNNGTPLRSLGTILDITKLQTAEATSRLLATAIEQAMETIVITDTNGTIEYVNPAFERCSGYSKEEALGQNPRVLKSGKHSEEFYHEMWQTLTSGLIWQGIIKNRRKDGTFFEEQATISPVLDDSGEVRHYVAVKRDISHEQELEMQLRQAQKMEAIGTLAGGIAHDFNNILAAILGYGEMAREQAEEGSILQQDIVEIIKAGSRAADLVQQILAFSRQAEQDFNPVQLQFIIKEAMKMLRASLPSTITIKEAIDTSCPPVLADPTQIHQIIVNLCTNAKQALQEQGGGQLNISLSQQILPQKNIALPSEVHGPYIELIVEDSGSGMDEKIMAKIFEPFFTTKEVGQGTGLGLSVVHGIVKSHHGHILAQSEPGQGTTFYIYLPVDLEHSSITDEVEEMEPIPGGSERIMVVDDEEIVVDVLNRMLRKKGYEVTSFTSSSAAYAHWQENQQRYDLLITDMTMPEMTGVELSMKILAQQPEFPIILATGYSETIDEKQAKAIGINGYIMKPIIPSTLCALIHKVLDTQETGDV